MICSCCEETVSVLLGRLCARCQDAERSARRSLRERLCAALEAGDRPEAVRVEKVLLDALRGPARVRRSSP